jgi:hypothetical protein
MYAHVCGTGVYTDSKSTVERLVYANMTSGFTVPAHDGSCRCMAASGNGWIASGGSDQQIQYVY